MDSSKDSEQEEDDKKILKPILALPYNFAKKAKKQRSLSTFTYWTSVI